MSLRRRIDKDSLPIPPFALRPSIGAKSYMDALRITAAKESSEPKSVLVKNFYRGSPRSRWGLEYDINQEPLPLIEHDDVVAAREAVIRRTKKYVKEIGVRPISILVEYPEADERRRISEAGNFPSERLMGLVRELSVTYRTSDISGDWLRRQTLSLLSSIGEHLQVVQGVQSWPATHDGRFVDEVAREMSYQFDVGPYEARSFLQVLLPELAGYLSAHPLEGPWGKCYVRGQEIIFETKPVVSTRPQRPQAAISRD